MVIGQVAKLRDLDSNPLENLVVTPPVGIVANEKIKVGDYSVSGFLSLADFSKNRSKLLEKAREGFEQLRERGKSLGLNICLENAYLASFQDSSYWKNRGTDIEEKSFGMHYEAFNDLEILREISGGKLVLVLLILKQ